MIKEFVGEFGLRTKKSGEIWQEAKSHLPGGVGGSAAYFSPHPVYIDRAVGQKLYDVDGNEYIDLLLGGFPLILGHSSEPIIDAVSRQLKRGTSYMLFQETGISLAKKMKEHMPHIEMVRFCNSGSEATMFAIRAARAWTGRDKIAKPEGGYNGQHDDVLVSGVSGRNKGSAVRPEGIADCAGIPRCVVENTVVLPWNDREASLAMIEENAKELAAVILEPVQGFGMGIIPADKEYLKAIREVTERNRIVLIYDEIVTGFRVSGLGGAVRHYGIPPDIGCYGKIMGGGFPIGAFGGRKDIMEKTVDPAADPNYKIFQSGTFTGNAVSMTAGLACLEELETKEYSYLDGLVTKLADGLEKTSAEQGIDLKVTRINSMFYPHFNNKTISSMRDKLQDNAERCRTFCLGLVSNGVWLPPNHSGSVSFAHTEEDIDRVLSISKQVLRTMREKNS